MRKQMSLQSKLLTTYSIFIILLIMLLGFSFYYYNASVFERNAYVNLDNMAKKMAQQLDNLIQPMDYISIDLLSRSDFMSAVASLAYLDKFDKRNYVFINESIQTIKASLLRDSINRTVYRVSVFNTKGDFSTSNFKVAVDYSNLDKIIGDIKWLEKVRERDGHIYMVPPHKDFWASREQAEVFSLVRTIRGKNGEMGFLEVQNTTDVLSKIFSVGVGKDINVLVINDENDIIYTSRNVNKEMLDYYSSISNKKDNSVTCEKNPVTKSVEFISHANSELSGWKVMVMQDRATLLESLAFTRNMTIAVGIALILLSMLFIYTFSKQLTKPLRKLKDMMEETSITNLPKKLKIENSSNEIELLNRAFQQMRERLNEAIQIEIKSRSLQLKASFDSLQAQINPHFLYNILNVIAAKGLASGDEEICEICDSIAAMLRYSTSTKNRTVKIGDEVEHVRNYLNLMKKRFEHKLEFYVEIDDRILDISIPKLILQPLVENSIYHGFNNSTGIMKIAIKGYITGSGWQIDVMDNGKGFSELVLEELKEHMKNFEKEICGDDGSNGLAIGGMGIVSTYARMSLFYKDEFKFELKNNPDGGACTSLGGNL